MASQPGSNPTTLLLTPSESKLRDLLLGVAAYIDEKPHVPAAHEVATGVKVPHELIKEKTVVRWTGGWVRDKLLGVGSHDIDVAINNMTGEHFGLEMLDYLRIPSNVEKHGLDQQEGKRIKTGLHTIKANPEASKNLETATIKIMGIDLDLVNLRKETYNEVSRNPEMEFGTAEEDAMRRDATVNAMFYNLNTMEIEDFTGRGFQDMEAKIIRTPLEPYQTFKDDPLRVLRLIRFASRLDYRIDPETEGAMGNKDIQEALKVKIKRERVGIELEKMLRGPRPRMALDLIDRLGLYGTIFTDPTRDLLYQPDTQYFRPAFDNVHNVIQHRSTILHLETLLRDAEEQYLAWVSAAVMPWVDAPQVPNSKPSRPPFHAACLVAQEGFKAPNKISDVIAASLNNREEIMTTVENCSKQLASLSSRTLPTDYTSREVLGMAIRRWGSTWRSQVFFTLLYELIQHDVSESLVPSRYFAFLEHLKKLEILDADTFKPLVNGKELASALNTKPGPWMKDALDEVMKWQLSNPDIKDPRQAIDALKDMTESELPSRLIRRLLRLTIQPLFPRTTQHRDRWKELGNEWCIDLLRWCLLSSKEEDIRTEFEQLRVPILRMMDDVDLVWKAKACEFITALMKVAPPDFIIDRGYDVMFSEELWYYFTYIPTLTPEKESVALLRPTYAAMYALFIRPDRPKDEQDKILDRIVREGVISPLYHFQNASNYPELTTLIISQIDYLFENLDINAILHVQSILGSLRNIISDSFLPLHPPLLSAAVKATEATIAVGYERIGLSGTLDLYRSTCTAWKNVLDQKDGGNITDAAKDGMQTLLKGLMAKVDLLFANQGPRARNTWHKTLRRRLMADSWSRDLFEQCDIAQEWGIEALERKRVDEANAAKGVKPTNGVNGTHGRLA